MTERRIKCCFETLPLLFKATCFDFGFIFFPERPNCGQKQSFYWLQIDSASPRIYYETTFLGMRYFCDFIDADIINKDIWVGVHTETLPTWRFVWTRLFLDWRLLFFPWRGREHAQVISDYWCLLCCYKHLTRLFNGHILLHKSHFTILKIVSKAGSVFSDIKQLQQLQHDVTFTLFIYFNGQNRVTREEPKNDPLVVGQFVLWRAKAPRWLYQGDIKV